MLSIYTGQHLETLRLLRELLPSLPAEETEALRRLAAPCLAWREEAARFYREELAAACGRTCFSKNRHDCCGREGIIVFFADFVVEALTAPEERLAAMEAALAADRGGSDCVYLGEGGCRWTTKPVACEMFLCDRVREEVLRAGGALREAWEAIRAREKSFTRPDRPVLFDDLERHFIERGVENPLMYYHHSPGLLRLKRRHGVGRLEPIARPEPAP